MKEIEVLVALRETKQSALQKLKTLEFKGKKSILDVYLYEKATGRFKIKPNQPSEILRLRKIDGRTILTYKKDIFKDGKWLYSEEQESEADDFDSMLRIMILIGHAEIARLENERHVYNSGEYEIVLEDVKGLGLFVEIEILTEQEVDVEKIKKEMQLFLRNLELDVSEELGQGKLELLLKK